MVLKYLKYKTILLLIFFFYLSSFLYGVEFEDIFDKVGVNILPLDFKIYINDTDKMSAGIEVALIELYFENSKNGIGFNILPIQYHYFNNNHMISLVNLTIYWNIFDLFFKSYDEDFNKTITLRNIFKNSIFGPYISFIYPNLYFPLNIRFDEYIFNIGFRYTLFQFYRLPNMLPIINIEGGLRYQTSEYSYYIGIRVGAMSIITF